MKYILITYLAVCLIIFLYWIGYMLAELRLNNPRDFKFGWAYKSGMYWFIVFVTSVPVINIICILAWYGFGANSFFSNLPSSIELYKRVKIKVLKTNNRNEAERSLQWFKTCQYCGCSDHRYMPEFKVITVDDDQSIYQLDCQVCSSVVESENIETLLNLWNDGSDEQRFNRWKRRTTKLNRLKTYLRACFSSYKDVKEIDIFNYGEIWDRK